MKDHIVSMSCQSALVRVVDPSTENLSHSSIVLVRLLRLASASTVGCVYPVATTHEKRASPLHLEPGHRALTLCISPAVCQLHRAGKLFLAPLAA